MSTRSNIGIENSDDTITAIYCHFDGYVKGVGKTLYEHYNTIDKVNELIALGDISSLGERINPIGKHSFDNREKGTTVAYHRDRGEDFHQYHFKDIQDYVETTDFDIDYLYLYKDNEWNVFGCYDYAGGWYSVKDALSDDKIRLR